MAPESKENIRQLLEHRARSTPEKTFLFSEIDGREWTYAEFDCVVDQTANMLRANGIAKGDVVSLLLPDSAERRSVASISRITNVRRRSASSTT